MISTEGLNFHSLAALEYVRHSVRSWTELGHMWPSNYLKHWLEGREDQYVTA